MTSTCLPALHQSYQLLLLSARESCHIDNCGESGHHAQYLKTAPDPQRYPAIQRCGPSELPRAHRREDISSSLLCHFSKRGRRDESWRPPQSRSRLEPKWPRNVHVCVCATCSVRCASHRARACARIVTLFTQALCAASRTLAHTVLHSPLSVEHKVVHCAQDADQKHGQHRSSRKPSRKLKKGIGNTSCSLHVLQRSKKSQHGATRCESIR